MSSSINQKEIAHFAKDSAHWWDESGPFGILHRLNPARMEYILSQTGEVKGKKILDVGCGGGLVCEPLARLGAKVTGIDADENAITVAKAHAAESELNITYICKPVEELQGSFDIVTTLEILEHVADPAGFLAECARVLKPGGLLIASTLNRTPQSYLFGIIGAEYIMRYVPRGTHSWSQFLKPSELATFGRQSRLEPIDMAGLWLNPRTQEFELSPKRTEINYFMSFNKL